jgi:hypothetical protein
MEIDEKFACLASLEYMCRHCGHITKVSTLPEEGK